MTIQYAYMHPDEKKKLSKYYDIAHDVAKKFCENHKNANAHEIYSSAETAARLYHKSDTIQAVKSAKDFISYKIKSTYERTLKRMTHSEKFKPIPEEIRLAIIADAKDNGMNNAKLAKKYNISSSSVTRILQKAGVIDPRVNRDEFLNKKKNKTNKKSESSAKSNKTEMTTNEIVETPTEQTKSPIHNEKTGSKKKFLSNTYEVLGITNKEPVNTEPEIIPDNNMTETNDAENLSRIISHLGLMLSDKLTSISILYKLNGNDVKIKIGKPEK